MQIVGQRFIFIYGLLIVYLCIQSLERDPIQGAPPLEQNQDLAKGRRTSHGLPSRIASLWWATSSWVSIVHWTLHCNLLVLLRHCELEEAGQGTAEQEKEIHSEIQHTVKNSENIPKSCKKKRLTAFRRGAVRPAVTSYWPGSSFSGRKREQGKMSSECKEKITVVLEFYA